MRSNDRNTETQPTNPFIGGFVCAVADVANVLVLLTDAIVVMTRRNTKTASSKPSEAIVDVQLT